MLKLISILSLMIILISCGKKEESTLTKDPKDQIKIIKSNSIREIDRSATAEHLFTIEAEGDGTIGDTLRIFKRPIDLEVDKNGNIYILDLRDSNIKKFDGEGNWVKTFGKQGTGPGEINRSRSMILMNDTIFVTDMRGRKLIKFDLDGNHVGDIAGFQDGVPDNLIAAGDRRTVGYLSIRNRKERKFGFDLSILDSKFEVVQSLKRSVFGFDQMRDMSIQDFVVPFAANGNNVYVSDNSEDNYKINKYDINGKLQSVLTKSYRKLKFSDIDAEGYVESMQQMRMFRNRDVEAPKYKKALSGLFIDDNGVLFSMCSTEKDFDGENTIFDIFENDKLVKRVAFPLGVNGNFYDMGERIIFQGGRIFIMDQETQSIKVFSYSL